MYPLDSMTCWQQLAALMQSAYSCKPAQPSPQPQPSTVAVSQLSLSHPRSVTATKAPTASTTAMVPFMARAVGSMALKCRWA